MTTDTNEQAAKSKSQKKTLLAMALGASAGFAATFVFLNLLGTDALPEIGLSRELAGLVAIVYLLIGLLMGFGLMSPKQGAKVLNVEDADEIEEERAQLLPSTLAMLLSGAALMVLALAQPVGPIAMGVALAVYVLAMVLSVYLSLAAQKRQDELMREVGKECAVAAYYLMFAIGGSWAVLAHLDYVAAPAPLDWLTMFWGVTLLAAFVVTARRGMMAMR